VTTPKLPVPKAPRSGVNFGVFRKLTNSVLPKRVPAPHRKQPQFSNARPRQQRLAQWFDTSVFSQRAARTMGQVAESAEPLRPCPSCNGQNSTQGGPHGRQQIEVTTRRCDLLPRPAQFAHGDITRLRLLWFGAGHPYEARKNRAKEKDLSAWWALLPNFESVLGAWRGYPTPRGWNHAGQTPKSWSQFQTPPVLVNIGAKHGAPKFPATKRQDSTI
jgi:hypothetical protein